MNSSYSFPGLSGPGFSNTSLSSEKYTPPFKTTQKVNLKAEKAEHFVDFDLSLKQAENMGLNRDTTFYSSLINAVELVNKEVVFSDKLTEQFVRKPNTISVHDVIIAQQKAELHLGLARNVLRNSITAYQNIINLR